MVAQILAENTEQIEQFKSGNQKVLGHLIGQVMKASEGKANPKMVNDILHRRLSE